MGSNRKPTVVLHGPGGRDRYFEVWFGIALITLFTRAIAVTDASGLQAISNAASQGVRSSPQTASIFAILVITDLILFALGTVILQNKIRKDHDFIYFSRLNAKLEELSRPDVS